MLCIPKIDAFVLFRFFWTVSQSNPDPTIGIEFLTASYNFKMAWLRLLMQTIVQGTQILWLHASISKSSSRFSQQKNFYKFEFRKIANLCTFFGTSAIPFLQIVGKGVENQWHDDLKSMKRAQFYKQEKDLNPNQCL